MNKKRHSRKKTSMKVFEMPGSSRDITPNPYSDDGEYGSDSNYDPGGDNVSSSSSSSDFVVRPKGKRKRDESITRTRKSEGDSTDSDSNSNTESVIEDTDDCVSSSSESIFDFRVRRHSKKDIPTPSSSKCKYQNALPPSKKPKNDNSGSMDPVSDGNYNFRDETDTDTISLASDVVRRVLGDDFTLENVSLPLDPEEQQQSNLDTPSQSEKKNGSPGLVLRSSPHPKDIDAKPLSKSTPSPLIDSLPPQPEEREAYLVASPLTSPRLKKTNINSVSLSPPKEIEVNLNNSPQPSAGTEDMERHLSSPGIPPAHLEEAGLGYPGPTSPSTPRPEEAPHREETLPSSGNHLTQPLSSQTSSSSADLEANVGLHTSPPSDSDATPTLQALTPAEANQPLSVSGPDNEEVSPTGPEIHRSRRRTRDSDLSARQSQRRNQSSPRRAAWETSTSDIPVFYFDESSTGLQFELRRDASPFDVFEQLFPPNIVDYIIAKTNNYGRKLCHTDRPSTRTARKYTYKDIDREELFKFLGICLLMGQINTPQKRKLFTYTDVLYFHPIFLHVMSARRFEQILRCLCVSELNAKKKDKIVNFIDAVTENFRKCYRPTKELSLDESLLLFRGRLSFRQYIKSKKARYGIKFYELATSDGYMLNMVMYTGKDDDDPTEHGRKTEKIVMRLMKPFLMKGHWLFMDNYYNSVTLAEKLLDLQTHNVGTLRSNRKCNPKEIVKKKLKKNEHVWVRKNKVYVSKWLDKRPILMLTTLNHPKLIATFNRHGQQRMKPEEIAIYNDHMAGVDRSDQMISYYSSPRRSLRWYKKVVFHLLDLTVWNSFFIYRKYWKDNSKKYEFLHFRDNLIRRLLQLVPGLKTEALMNRNRYDNRLHAPREVALPTSSGNVGHWPEKIPVRINSKKTSTYMKCKMCTKKKMRRETSLRCMGCEEKPALCAVCFHEWHNQ